MSGKATADMLRRKEEYFRLRLKGLTRQAAADFAGVAVRTTRTWEPETAIKEKAFLAAKAVVEKHAGIPFANDDIAAVVLREAIQAYIDTAREMGCRITG